MIGRKPGRELLRGEVGSILSQGEVVFTFVPLLLTQTWVRSSERSKANSTGWNEGKCNVYRRAPREFGSVPQTVRVAC